MISESSNVTSPVDKFQELFDSYPITIEAPGRINLIGEHTDYNNGFVLPAAIDKKATFALAANNRNEFRFYAMDLDQMYQTEKIEPASKDFHWANYLLGVLEQFENKGIKLTGIDCVFSSSIPIGAGLSSSAAIECGFAFGLNQILQSGFTKFQLIKMAQSAEHEYAGVMCGIMDQFASIFGKKDHVFRLDCRSNEYNYYPFEMKDFAIALVDTKVKHKLASSEYNQRRKECEKGVELLKKANPAIESLRDVCLPQLTENINSIDPTIFKRCYYVVEENQRVLDACTALEQFNFIKFGKLMYQSHNGLKDNYQVSCDELDLLVDITKNMDYVLGARMMGGGFGGCTINLIKSGFEEGFKKQISDKYMQQTGIKPVIYEVKISDGTKLTSN